MTDLDKKMHHDGKIIRMGMLIGNLRISVFCFIPFWNKAGF